MLCLARAKFAQSAAMDLQKTRYQRRPNPDTNNPPGERRKSGARCLLVRRDLKSQMLGCQPSQKILCIEHFARRENASAGYLTRQNARRGLHDERGSDHLNVAIARGGPAYIRPIPSDDVNHEFLGRTPGSVGRHWCTRCGPMNLLSNCHC
jgi:hypothetical protein